MRKIINIIGLPGSGKTTLAKKVAALLNAIHINADWARSTVTSHLGFSEADRVTQARTLGQLAALTIKNQWTVVDFVSPTSNTRHAFNEATCWRQLGGTDSPGYRHDDDDAVFTVWMDTIHEGRFADTNKLFEPPHLFDMRVPAYLSDADFDSVAADIVREVTADMKSYHIRFNTVHAGSPLKWRIIEAATGEERLATAFDLRCHMTPSITVEHDVEKYNVFARGFPSWEGDVFRLEF